MSGFVARGVDTLPLKADKKQRVRVPIRLCTYSQSSLDQMLKELDEAKGNGKYAIKEITPEEEFKEIIEQCGVDFQSNKYTYYKMDTHFAGEHLAYFIRVKK